MEVNYCTILYWFCHTSTIICHRYTRVPILNPPPSSLPVPSLWVVPVHQPQVSSIMHWTWASNSFRIWYYTGFNAILPNHPTLSLSHKVQKTVLYICVSFAVSTQGYHYHLSIFHIYTISSVRFSRSVVSDSLRPYELQHTRPPCPSPTPRVLRFKSISLTGLPITFTLPAS